MSPARVVITGFGAITPLGLTATELWTSLCAGRSGIDTITAFDPAGFDCTLAGQAPGLMQSPASPSHLCFGPDR